MKKILSAIMIMLLYCQAVISQEKDLVFHWSFDDVENDKFGEQVRGIYGGELNGAQIVPGVKGNALAFDGLDDYAIIPGNGLSPPEALASLAEGTISLWFKVNNIPLTNGIRPIFYYGRSEACDFFDASNQGMIIEVGHSPIHNGSRRLYFTIWSNECSYPTFCYDSWIPIEEGEWYHYVAVVGEHFNTGYLNGDLMVDRHYNFGNPSTSQFFEDATANDKMWLGKGYWDGQEVYFDGVIDEVKIYNYAISADEVAILYGDEQLPSAVKNIKEGLDISFYPNPASNSIIIEDHSDLLSGDLQIQILDVMSRTTIWKNIAAEKNNIDVSNLNKGVYIISLFQDGKLIGNQKFVKQ